MNYQAQQREFVQRLNSECEQARYSAEVAASAVDYHADTRVFLAIIAFLPESALAELEAIQACLAEAAPTACRVAHDYQGRADYPVTSELHG